MKMTAEQKKQCLSAALDSVAVINSVKDEWTTVEEHAATIARNKEHLKTILAYPCWTGKDDLTVIHEASL